MEKSRLTINEEFTFGTDAVLYEPGTEIARFDSNVITVKLTVEGDTHVIHKGGHYEHVDDFPEDLLEILRGESEVDSEETAIIKSPVFVVSGRMQDTAYEVSEEYELILDIKDLSDIFEDIYDRICEMAETELEDERRRMLTLFRKVKRKDCKFVIW